MQENNTLDMPSTWLCPADLNTATLGRLSRPNTFIATLYHPENFPLPRFPLGISDLARAARTTLMGTVTLADMQREFGRPARSQFPAHDSESRAHPCSRLRKPTVHTCLILLWERTLWASADVLHGEVSTTGGRTVTAPVPGPGLRAGRRVAAVPGRHPLVGHG
ncbi:hypothetical protein GCM10010329_78260 [Streptomyces spiroverticillatus]|uniref:Uncharacterized protein n=1 Tax=Streptomyces finlayi TaxID=67296 RepID=A0A918X5D0_9ACTN|nr:hypothetical protein GCM10010329_78260 [Streptomyces spiroverticillatus]GHD13224.1 hypothetical protein GCM10010334_71090 [Streptomyces finlayi]